MAYHQVNDKVLNDEEYKSHKDGNWILGLFVFGAILAGVSSYEMLLPFLPEGAAAWLKTTVVVTSSVISGVVFALLHKFIRIALAVLFFVGIVSAIILGVYSSVL